MRMTIYVPDDLAELLKGHNDLNVSAVCQAALRAELGRRETVAELQDGMERIELWIESRNGQKYDDHVDVAFVGKPLFYDGHNSAYLTRRGRIAIHNDDAQDLYEFDSFGDLASDDAWTSSHAEMVAAIAAELGEKYVIELDI